MADDIIPRGTYTGIKLVAGGRYAYHRKTRTRLRSPVGTPEFEAELAALNGLVAARNDPLHGSLAGLFDAYRRSPEFRHLAPRTRGDYEKIFLFLRPGAERKLLLNFRVRDALEIRNAAESRHWYCKVPCSSFAANPSKWPLQLPLDPDRPGVCVVVCTGCVLARLKHTETTP